MVNDIIAMQEELERNNAGIRQLPDTAERWCWPHGIRCINAASGVRRIVFNAPIGAMALFIFANDADISSAALEKTYLT
jgi:hypothetical protein